MPTLTWPKMSPMADGEDELMPISLIPVKLALALAFFGNTALTSLQTQPDELYSEEDIEDILPDEHLFPQATFNPEPHVQQGLLTYKAPVPRTKFEPQFRRCMASPETHPFDGQYDGTADAVFRVDERCCFAQPGYVPPDAISEYWDRLLQMLDQGLQTSQPNPAWMKNKWSVGTGQWQHYDDDIPRDIASREDPYRIREGRCNASRDIFAIGGLIVKSNHRHAGGEVEGGLVENKYLLDDFREVNVRRHLEGNNPYVMGAFPPPKLYFAGVLRGKNVLILERLKGISLSRMIPHIGSAGVEIVRNIMRSVVQMLGNEHQNCAELYLFYGEMLPQNIFVKFSLGYTDVYGNEVFKYTYAPGEPLPQLVRLSGLIDWKNCMWLSKEVAVGQHQLWFHGGKENGDLQLPENPSDVQLKSQLWHDMYKGLF